jgi:RNA polymerase sigma-70 factor (ECF subfamily)
MVFIEFLFLRSHRAVRVRQDGDASDDESVTAMVSDDQLRDGFEVERARLQRIAARILGEADAAQDVVQQAWLRLHASDEPIANLAG